MAFEDDDEATKVICPKAAELVDRRCWRADVVATIAPDGCSEVVLIQFTAVQLADRY